MVQLIPKQLKDCRFCKIKKGEKAPFEKNWQNKIISYDLISMYFPEYNYGVLCGYNQLAVLDDDTEDKMLMKLFEENFNETFQVRGHYYIYLKGWDKKKIIFYDGEKHLGELQGMGTQVVGAGSLHPCGEYYELIKDIPIIEIDFKDFKKVFEKYIKKKIISQRTAINESWNGSNINKIPIQNVLPPRMSEKSKDCDHGSHPIHGSESGNNFAINRLDNTWYCFRCQSGGGIWTAIAVSERMIECSEAKGYSFSEQDRKKIIKIAHEKYGLEFGDK